MKSSWPFCSWKTLVGNLSKGLTGLNLQETLLSWGVCSPVVLRVVQPLIRSSKLSGNTIHQIFCDFLLHTLVHQSSLVPTRIEACKPWLQDFNRRRQGWNGPCRVHCPVPWLAECSICMNLISADLALFASKAPQVFITRRGIFSNHNFGSTPKISPLLALTLTPWPSCLAGLCAAIDKN